MTTIYVTHDQVEAMTMGDRVAVMRKGELQQVADPQTLYDRPVNLFVGGFIGSPAMNMVEATIERANGEPRGRARRARRSSSTRERSTRRPGARGVRGQRRSILGIRPEHLEDAALAPDTPAGRRLRGTRRAARGARLGADGALRRRGRAPAETEETKELASDVGARSSTARRRPLDALSSAGSARARSVSEGEPVEVAVDTRALHFFDPETGLGIYDAMQEKGAAS